MGSKRQSRSEIFSGVQPVEKWPKVKDSVLPTHQRKVFNNRCKAIRMYVSGAPVDLIQKVTGIPRTQLSTLARKCIELASDGQILGFRGLLPFARLKDYTRTAEVKRKFQEGQGGMSGVFMQTLNKYPEIAEKLVQYIKKENTPDHNVHEKKIRAKDLQKLFLDALKVAGVGQHQWPFDTKHRARKTIQIFLEKVLNGSFGRSVTMREEQDAVAHMAVGTGYERFLSYEEPFDCVQLDAYKIEAFFTAEFETPEGTTTDLQLERIWLIALIEACSGSILANSVVYRSEVGADDVVSVLRKAVNPPQRIELTIPGLEYPGNAGLLSEVIPACQGALWGSLLLDGALAHLSNAVRIRAREQLGFNINWGPVAHFERRPDIERFFGAISKELFLRMPSTSGSNPGKGRAKDAEKNAIKYKIRAEECEQLIAIYTAQHNATPTEGNSYNSPLDVLKYFVEEKVNHFLIRHLPQNSAGPSTLIPLVFTCVIRGGRSSGRRPYIQIDGVRYTSPVLAQASGLIGQKLTVEMDEEDFRFGKAYLSSGAELGLLKAQGRWHLTKHSRKTRKAINSLITKKILVVTSFDDPVQVYLDHLTKKQSNRGKNKPILNPKDVTEAHRVAKDAGVRNKITHETQPNLNEATLAEILSSRPSVTLTPMPDLNELIKRK